MTELLKVLLSPHIVWGGILVFFAFKFKDSFSKLLGAITDRIKNVQGYKKTKDGHEVIFGSEQQTNDENILPNSSDSAPNVQPETAGQSVWLEDNTEGTIELRQIVKAERATRYLWEYRYLNYFLARHTQLVLDWLVSLESPPTYQLFENFWFQLIPEEKERKTVLDVLSAHYLIQISEAGLINATPKGIEYRQWRGPLPQLK